MTKFRPCIDLHNGQVKQIVGGSLTGSLVTNFVSSQPATFYAQMYRDNKLTGGHLIMLGGGNESVATECLKVWPMQIGGGINLSNAM